MLKIKLSLLSFFCISLIWSQLPKMEKTLNVMDFKIVNNDTLKVHWYSAESNDLSPSAAIAFFLEVAGEGVSILIFKGKLYISLKED